MSFASIVKNEVSKINTNDSEKLTLLSAIVHDNYNGNIKITTENASIARLVFQLFKDVCRKTPKITVRNNYQNHYLYILEMNNQKCIKQLSLTNIPPKYLLDDEECVRSYLMGLFLMSGSINDPKTSRYHLEFNVDNLEYANFISELLNKYNLNSKVIKKGNTYMVYIKEAEKIGDFLRIIKAFNAVLYYEDIRIYRDHKNMTNRLNNCEQANVDKMIQASSEQLELIRKLRETRDFDLLEQGIKDICIYKEKYPESSMAELAEIISTETERPITKSGINHRFRKIKEMVK